MYLRSQSGAGLMDILLGAGLLGGLAIGGAKMMSSSGQTSKKIATKLEISEFSKRVARFMSSPAACTRSLRTIDATNGPVGALYGYQRDGTEYVTLDSSMKYGPTLLQVESMRLFDSPGTQDGVQVVPGDSGTTNLELKFFFPEGSVNYRKDIRTKISVSVQTDAAGKVVSCRSLEGGGATLWKRVVTRPADIYYDEGKVGVGTNNPVRLLDVFGPVSARNEIGGRIILGGSTGLPGITVDTDVPLEPLVDITSRPVNLIPGSVILDGLLQLSNSTATCTNANRGAVRYNASQVQVCEPSGWVNKKVGPLNDGYQGSPHGPVPSTHSACPVRPARFSPDSTSEC